MFPAKTVAFSVLCIRPRARARSLYHFSHSFRLIILFFFLIVQVQVYHHAVTTQQLCVHSKFQYSVQCGLHTPPVREYAREVIRVGSRTDNTASPFPISACFFRLTNGEGAKSLKEVPYNFNTQAGFDCLLNELRTSFRLPRVFWVQPATCFFSG